MIVKVENDSGEFVRWDDCLSVCIKKDEDGPDGGRGWLLICSYPNDNQDALYPLDSKDRIYLMNDTGQTIDQDLRMCQASVPIQV